VRQVDDENKEQEYEPGQLDFWTELFERGPDGERKRGHPASKLDDITFKLSSPGEKEQGEDDPDEWPYGEI